MRAPGLGVWRPLGLAVALASAGLASGCGDSGDGEVAGIERHGSVVVAGNAERTEVRARPQRIDGDRLVVDDVRLEAAGYVAVHLDGAGAPGERIGTSALLDAGAHEDVIIELEVPPGVDSGTTPLHLVVYVERTGDETLDFPGDDAPVTDDGGVVTLSFDVGVVTTR